VTTGFYLIFLLPSFHRNMSFLCWEASDLFFFLLPHPSDILRIYFSLDNYWDRVVKTLHVWLSLVE
jgi:hypothetical protein